jgi:hypothetical protein
VHTAAKLSLLEIDDLAANAIEDKDEIRA